MTRQQRVGKMPVWQRTITWSALLFCGLSGLAYLFGHEFLLLRDLLGSHAVLVAHGISAALCIFAIGAVSAGHIRLGLNVRKNVNSGLAQTTVLLTLIVTGLGLYYGREEIRDGLILTHWIIGIALLPLFFLHVCCNKRKPLANSE